MGHLGAQLAYDERSAQDDEWSNMRSHGMVFTLFSTLRARTATPVAHITTSCTEGYEYELYVYAVVFSSLRYPD
jgi:hypothetical protein